MASLEEHGIVSAGQPASHVFPIGSRVNETGRLEVGGCDLVELAREFGTPAYVYAEDDIRARARGYVEAFRARVERFEIVYASKACPATPVLRLLAAEGLSCDVASGGELHLALGAGFAKDVIALRTEYLPPLLRCVIDGEADLRACTAGRPKEQDASSRKASQAKEGPAVVHRWLLQRNGIERRLSDAS